MTLQGLQSCHDSGNPKRTIPSSRTTRHLASTTYAVHAPHGSQTRQSNPRFPTFLRSNPIVPPRRDQGSTPRFQRLCSNTTCMIQPSNSFHAICPCHLPTSSLVPPEPSTTHAPYAVPFTRALSVTNRSTYLETTRLELVIFRMQSERFSQVKLRPPTRTSIPTHTYHPSNHASAPIGRIPGFLLL